MTIIAPSSRSLSEQVEKILRDEIISGIRSPGERIDINVLAETWSVSPTPIREAVKSLGSQGLIKVSPRRGSFVAGVDRKALRDIFQLRISLEELATSLATPIVPDDEANRVLERYRRAEKVTGKQREKILSEVDNSIHILLVKYCGNDRLIKIMDGLRDHVNWAQQTIIVREPYSEALSDHIKIAEAVCSHDVDEAVGAMRTHLKNTWARLEAHLDSEGL